MPTTIPTTMLTAFTWSPPMFLLTRRQGLRGLIVGMAWAVAACAPTQAAEAWSSLREASSRDDVSTWVRPVPGMAVKAFKGQTEVHATAWNVLALLADTPHLAAWLFQGKSSEHVEGTPPEQAYLRFKGVWPADDRDVHIRTELSQLADGSILVDSRQVDSQVVQSGFVRIPVLKNSFRLTPLPGGWTRVVFETQIDLGGMVPNWLANAVSTNAPLVTLRNLHKEVQAPAYLRVKAATELPQYYHHGGLFVLPPAHLQPAVP